MGQITLSGVTKRFGAFVANDAVSIELRRGEMLALLGENGAGKTTLMNVLFGHYVAESGVVRVADAAGELRPLPPGSPAAALAAGVGMVQQHFALAGSLSVLENVVLGTRPLLSPRLGLRAARARLAALAEPVAEMLADADPDNADTYAQGAEDLAAELTDLDADLRAGLATCERRVLVTSHEAFGYLTHAYDLEQVGISGVDPDAEPSPARLREIGDVVRAEGVTTIFTETLVDPEVAQTLADDLGVTTAVLNAVVAEELPGPGSVFLQLDLRFLHPVRPGDVITAATFGKVRVLRVISAGERRGPATEARLLYEDLTDPPDGCSAEAGEPEDGGDPGAAADA